MVGLGAFFELEVTCRGEADPRTGYLMNITEIDQAVRAQALPIIERACHAQSQQPADPERALSEIMRALMAALPGRLYAVAWNLTPYHALSMTVASPEQLCLSQHFEFAASHRLHVDSMSAEENRRVFGKCHNPNGHGHNYRLQVTVAKPFGGELTMTDIERIVDGTVVQRFDHKHLNLDTAEFKELNPSVEHIARTCFELLRSPLLAVGGELRKVTVWETEKTSSTYPAI